MEPLDPRTLARGLQEYRASLGPDVLVAIDDPATTEIWANPDGCIWIKRLGRPKERLAIQMSVHQRQAILNVIANLCGAEINPRRPFVEAFLPTEERERFQGEMPPLSPNGPMWNIRKKPKTVPTLEHYLNDGIITPQQSDILIRGLERRENFGVLGPTGSGKTLFLNMMMNHPFATRHRQAIIQDNPELRGSAPDLYELIPTLQVDARQCVKICLRKSPERIFFGEVRDGTAYDLMKVMNTGHPGGGFTLHTDSLEDAPYRLEDLCTEAIQVSHVARIVRTIDLLIMIEPIADAPYRRVTGMGTFDRSTPHAFKVVRLD